MVYKCFNRLFPKHPNRFHTELSSQPLLLSSFVPPAAAVEQPNRLVDVLEPSHQQFQPPFRVRRSLVEREQLWRLVKLKLIGQLHFVIDKYSASSQRLWLAPSPPLGGSTAPVSAATGSHGPPRSPFAWQLLADGSCSEPTLYSLFDGPDRCPRSFGPTPWTRFTERWPPVLHTVRFVERNQRKCERYIHFACFYPHC